MTTIEVANLIPDDKARTAWVAAGMPTDLSVVAEIVVECRKGIVRRAQEQCHVRHPKGYVMSRPHVAV